MTQPRILFLTKYSALGASSRYRMYQYLQLFRASGLQCTVAPLLPDAYLTAKYAGMSPLQASYMSVRILAWMAARWKLLLREASQYDAVYLQYEVLPYVPLLGEELLFRINPRVVVDYDDAIYLNYERHSNRLVRRVLGAKIPGIVARSRHVVVGNAHLGRWACQYNDAVTIIPTSVDLRCYPSQASTAPPNGLPVIGWIGTPITAKYLSMLAEPLRALRRRHEFVLKVIGVPGFSIEGIDVVTVPWNESTEVAELQTCDIGVMPVPDDPWARGKSALKLIQYLAAGKAAVASPVGANCDVVEDGRTGFLASTGEEWTEKLAVLIARSQLREQLGSAGRQAVEERFCVQVNTPRMEAILRRAAEGT